MERPENSQYIESLQGQLAVIDAKLERWYEIFPGEDQKPYMDQHPIFKSRTGGLQFQRQILESQLNPDI